MQMMADLLRQGRYTDEVMGLVSRQEQKVKSKPVGFGV